MPSQKDEAERLRLGILGGWLAVDDVVAWADRQIQQTGEPDAVLIELSLAGSRMRHEVGAILVQVRGSADATQVMRRCLGDLLRVVQREPQLAHDAARGLEAAASRGELPSAEFGSEPFQLADGFTLAKLERFGTVEDARARLLEFLARHATAAG